jgi:hypothetical protein
MVMPVVVVDTMEEGGLPFQVTLISEFLEVVDQVGLAVANLHIFLWVVSIREMAR